MGHRWQPCSENYLKHLWVNMLKQRNHCRYGLCQCGRRERWHASSESSWLRGTLPISIRVYHLNKFRARGANLPLTPIWQRFVRKIAYSWSKYVEISYSYIIKKRLNRLVTRNRTHINHFFLCKWLREKFDLGNECRNWLLKIACSDLINEFSERQTVKRFWFVLLSHSNMNCLNRIMSLCRFMDIRIMSINGTKTMFTCLVHHPMWLCVRKRNSFHSEMLLCPHRKAVNRDGQLFKKHWTNWNIGVRQKQQQ